MDFKKMTDAELASVMVNYIGRVENLLHIIAQYLDGNDSVPPERIRREYENLKIELREDGHYIDLERNYHGSPLYMGDFRSSIRGAATFGFGLPINCRIDQKMYSAVEEARYRLTKYLSEEEWGDLM